MENTNKVEWVSPEVKKLYFLFNKAYNIVVKRNNPHVKYLIIDPNSFNNIFITDEYVIDVDVNICIDWHNIPSNSSVGKDLISYFKDLTVFFGNVDKFKSKFILPDAHFISTRDCEDIGSNKIEANESEITERCWKGYTQKGMKTMFGKRYPNCVKKTKK